ncbi:MAG: cupin domain-containing protein [Bacteroidota bacterium]
MENKINTLELSWTAGKIKGFSGKELLLLPNGGLKLIKVSPLATYPEHLHPDKTEYAYVLEGTPEIIINSETYIGTIGDFFIFPLNTKHSIKNKTNFECILLIGSIQN